MDWGIEQESLCAPAINSDRGLWTDFQKTYGPTTGTAFWRHLSANGQGHSCIYAWNSDLVASIWTDWQTFQRRVKSLLDLRVWVWKIPSVSWNWFDLREFLVACMRLYTPLGRSVGRSVGLSHFTFFLDLTAPAQMMKWPQLQPLPTRTRLR